MNRRIALVLRTKNITPSQFAEELGVQRSGISHILNGRNKPSLEFIQKLIKKYPDISMNWLMFGEGPMMNPYPTVEPIVPKTTNAAQAKPVVMELFGMNQEDNSAVDSGLDNIIDENQDSDEQEDVKDSEVQLKEQILVNSKENQPVNNTASKMDNGVPGKSQRLESKYIQPTQGRQIKRIIIFYDDRSFVEYFPGEE